MPKVVMYGTAFCPYCMRARQLLDHKGVDYEDIRVDKEPQRRSEMIQLSNGRTSVPQIFIDNFHVGGCDDMFDLERNGQLDQHLGLTANAS